ncbi:hypothetical protein BROUX41_000179 [Berkeleyomyces rouxiae]|uniref:uncharacterized protein n=1 Tax=Berkeleyomyces rouxiae TaxID=2035830 RepID=UPI003B7D8AEB
MATTTKPSTARRADTLHAPDARSHSSSSCRTATSTCNTTSASTALKPRASSSGVNLDIRRAFAVAAAAAHAKAHSKKHHHYHQTPATATPLATPALSSATTPTKSSQTPLPSSSTSVPRKPPAPIAAALHRPQQRKRSVDLDALIAPLKKRRLIPTTASSCSQEHQPSPQKTPTSLKKQSQLFFKQSPLKLPPAPQRFDSTPARLSPQNPNTSLSPTPTARIVHITASPSTQQTAHTPAPPSQLLTPPASTEAAVTKKAFSHPANPHTPCKKSSAKFTGTTYQSCSLFSNTPSSPVSEAAAIVATRASKVTGGDTVPRDKDGAASTAPTSLPSRPNRKENAAQTKATPPQVAEQSGSLKLEVDAVVKAKPMTAAKDRRKDTSPTGSTSVSPDSQETGGRKLRSQETTGFKSELSLYFPEYDVVIGNVQKEENVLEPSTAISISGEAVHISPSVKTFTDAAFVNPYDVERFDLGSLELGEVEDDPLPDMVYEPYHRKVERQEKNVRNTERCRAQHERDQVVRILDGLQGPDWLKVLGVMSPGEGRKKSFEPIRRHFIEACEAVLDKFRQWSVEEKRRKAEKERALSHAVEFPALKRDRTASVKSESSAAISPDDDEDDKSIACVSVVSSSYDASLDKQLYEETITAEKNHRPRKRKDAIIHDEAPPRKRQVSPFLPTPPPAAVAVKEMTSFFAKRHERDAAVHRHRRGGRNILAFGQPMPDMPVHDFELPEELLGGRTGQGEEAT